MNNKFDVVTLFSNVLGDKVHDYTLPPESFTVMGCEIIDFDPEGKSIVVTMPLKDFTLNPYNTMQGGFISAAIDNAIGPLSMLVAPLNMSRRMTTEYLKPLTKEIELYYIKAKVTEIKGRKIFFEASISSKEGTVYATASVENWLIKQ